MQVRQRPAAPRRERPSSLAPSAGVWRASEQTTGALTPSQASALLASCGRQLGWGLRAVSKEIDRWRSHAATIPDERLRSEALRGLNHRRGHIDGAALLWTLPSKRDVELLRVLVAYEVLQDYLDGVSEHAARAGATDSAVLFRAVGDALDPDRPLSGDFYAELPWSDDGGYLAALVSSCREGVRRLPSFVTVRPLLVREGARATVLGLNHVADSAQRDAALRIWVDEALPADMGMPWYELAAAASGWITTLVLLATAAEPGVSAEEARATYEAYFPSFALALTLLDSWADQEADARVGDHNYVAHFPSRDAAVRRLCETIERTAADVLRLPRGERHAVVLACMVALYTTERSARTRELKPMTARIVRSGGTLTRVLVPALAVWRLLNFRYGATN